MSEEANTPQPSQPQQPAEAASAAGAPAQAASAAPDATAQQPGAAQPGAQASPYASAQAAPYAPAQQQPPAPGGAPVQKATNGKAIAAIICGIFALVTCPFIVPSVILGIVAIILGVLAKKQGPSGMATAGVVTGAIGIVLGIVFLAVYFALGVWVANTANDAYSAQSSLISSQSSTDDNNSILGSGDSAQDAAQRLVDEELSQYTEPSTRDLIASSLESAFSSSAGVTMDDLGLTSDEFADWVLDDIACTVNSVDESGDTAVAHTTLTMRDYSTFEQVYSDKLTDYMDSTDFTNATSMDEVYKQMGNVLRESMNATGTTQVSLDLDMEKRNGEWVLDTTATSDLSDALSGSGTVY